MMSSPPSSSSSSAFPSSPAIGIVLRLVVLSVLLVVQRTRQDDVSTATVAIGNGPLSMPTGSSRSFILAQVGTVSKATDARTSVGVNKQAPGGATSDAVRYVMDDPQTNDNTSAAADTNRTAATSLSESATGGSTTTSASSSFSVSSTSSSVALQVMNSSGIVDGIVDWIRFYSRSSGNGSDSSNETRAYYSSTLVEDDDEAPERPPADDEDGGSQTSPNEVPQDDAEEQEQEDDNDRREEIRPSGKLCGKKNNRGVVVGERGASSAAAGKEGPEDDDYSLYDNEGRPEMGEGTASLVSSQTGNEGGKEEEQEVEEGSEGQEEEDGERGLRDCIQTSPVSGNGSTTVRGMAGVEGADSPRLPLPPPLHQTTETIDQTPILAETGDKSQEPLDSHQPLVVLHSGKDSEDLVWLENGENGFVRTFCWLSLATISMFTLIGSIRYRQEILCGLKQIRLAYATRDRRQKPTVEEANTLLSHAQV